MFLSIVNNWRRCAFRIVDDDGFGHSQWQKADKRSCKKELHLVVVSLTKVGRYKNVLYGTDRIGEEATAVLPLDVQLCDTKRLAASYPLTQQLGLGALLFFLFSLSSSPPRLRLFLSLSPWLASTTLYSTNNPGGWFSRFSSPRQLINLHFSKILVSILLELSFDLCSPLPHFDTLISQFSFPLITSVITVGIGTSFVLLSLLLVVYWKVQSDKLSSEVDIYSWGRKWSRVLSYVLFCVSLPYLRFCSWSRIWHLRRPLLVVLRLAKIASKHFTSSDKFSISCTFRRLLHFWPKKKKRKERKRKKKKKVGKEEKQEERIGGEVNSTGHWQPLTRF